MYPTVDLDLARRLERAEAAAGAAFVDARREVDPSEGALWMEVAGVYAMFDGPSSPVTQTFGLGVFDPIGGAELDRLERFFADRGAATHHEVSAFAPDHIWNLLSARGYTPIETSTVLVRPTRNTAPLPSSAVVARLIKAGEEQRWARILGEGWSSESPEVGTMVEGLGPVIRRARGVRCFIAEVAGRPIAAGSLNVSNGVALLAGASTIPSARRQGAQAALLRARLDFAASLGIDVAMVVTLPASASQRNSVRQGFRPVYMRSKWQLETGGA